MYKIKNNDYLGAKIFSALTLGCGVLGYTICEEFYYGTLPLTLVTALETADGYLRRRERKDLENILK